MVDGELLGRHRRDAKRQGDDGSVKAKEGAGVGARGENPLPPLCDGGIFLIFFFFFFFALSLMSPGSPGGLRERRCLFFPLHFLFSLGLSTCSRRPSRFRRWRVERGFASYECAKKEKAKKKTERRHTSDERCEQENQVAQKIRKRIPPRFANHSFRRGNSRFTLLGRDTHTDQNNPRKKKKVFQNCSASTKAAFRGGVSPPSAAAALEAGAVSSSFRRRPSLASLDSNQSRETQNTTPIDARWTPGFDEVRGRWLF